MLRLTLRRGRREDGYQSVSKSANDCEFTLIASTVLSLFPLFVQANCIELTLLNSNCLNPFTAKGFPIDE